MCFWSTSCVQINNQGYIERTTYTTRKLRIIHKCFNTSQLASQYISQGHEIYVAKEHYSKGATGWNCITKKRRDKLSQGDSARSNLFQDSK